MSVNEKMTAIADAIRGKTGKTDALTLDQMATEIAGIQAGGGAVSGDGWVSGVQYDLNLVKNSYADAKGVITAFNGWDRTDYLPCHGVAALVHTPSIQNQYYAFYDANFSPISTKPAASGNVVLSVPESAFYYVYSNKAETMAVVAIIPLAFKEAEA